MGKKKIVAVIPARMGASRFPGKPLAEISGLPMIEHVRRRVGLCRIIDEVYVATCDQEIMNVVQKCGGNAIMTANTHERCTERVEEAMQHIEADIIAIFQGDEPLFVPEVAGILLKPIVEDESIVCTSLLSKIENEEDLQHQDIVKTVLDKQENVLYFSRAPIPFLRVRKNCPLYRQTGLSAFTKDFLEKFSNLAPTPLEVAESVDFLRIIEHGYPIKGAFYNKKMYGVDRPEDVGMIEKILDEDEEQRKIHKSIIG